jgi:hypothetical protein
MEIGHAIQVVESFANQYNHGDVLQAMEDMFTIREELTYEENQALLTVLRVGNKFFEKA